MYMQLQFLASDSECDLALFIIVLSRFRGRYQIMHSVVFSDVYIHYCIHLPLTRHHFPIKMT